jgi:hypothetical protein
VLPFHFFVHNRNHVRLFAPVAAGLRARQCDVGFVDLEAWHFKEGAVSELEKWGLRSTSIADFSVGLKPEGIYVVANDWGPPAFAQYLRGLDQGRNKIVGLVEGSQFSLPHRLSSASYVCGWGPSAARCFMQPVFQVGSAIVEAAAARKTYFAEPPMAVINYRFAYNNLDKADAWLRDVLKACEKNRLHTAISPHPSNHVERPLSASASPVDELLDRASLLVTRPSTTAYEAMARGKPVVIFGIQNETLAEFANPMGAFGVAYDVDALARLIGEALQRRESYATVCAPFLRAHVLDQAPGTAVEKTIVALLELALRS